MYYVYIYKDASCPRIGTTCDFASLFSTQIRPYYFKFTNRDTAYNFEQYLRSESGRAFVKEHGFLDLYFLANALQYAHDKAVRKIYNT